MREENLRAHRTRASELASQTSHFGPRLKLGPHASVQEITVGKKVDDVSEACGPEV